MSDEQALQLRREWEAWRDARDRELEARHRAEMAQRDAFEAAGVQVRVELTKRLGDLLDSLEPYVDGTMGEVTAAMSSVYVKAAHELAGMYGLLRVARPVTAAPVRVEPPVVEEPGVVEERRVAAVAAAREEILGVLAAVNRRAIEAS